MRIPKVPNPYCCSDSVVVGSDSAPSWTAAHQALLSSTISQSLLKFMSALVNSFCCHFSFKTWGLPSRSSQTVSCKNNERGSLGSVPEK